jgi:hypothetical protein
MPLTLATPTAAITTLPGGLKIVRLKDYVGSARGTLSVVSDSLSVGGNVIKEEQQRTPPTNITQYNALIPDDDDTAVIPYIDLDLDPGINYTTFLSARTTGDTPSNCRLNQTWASHGFVIKAQRFNGNAGEGSTKRTADLARSNTPHYMLYWFGFLSLSGITESTDTVHIRTHGVTGGDLAIYLDCWYLIPYDVYNNGLAAPWTDNDFRNMADLTGWTPLDFRTNGLIQSTTGNPARDTVPVSWLGDQSVMIAKGSAWGTLWGGTVVDFQKAESEPTGINLNNNDFGGPLLWDDDPKSDLWVTGGVKIWNEHTIENDGFTRTTSSFSLGDSPYPYTYTYSGAECTLNCDGSKAKVGHPSASFASYAYATLGSSAGPGTLYTDFKATLSDLWSFEIDIIVELSAAPSVDIEFFAGANLAGFPLSSNPELNNCGARLKIDSSGNVKLRLESRRQHITPAKVFGTETTIATGFSSSDRFHLKVQRDLYKWRAKAWKVGNSEPSTWAVEGQEPGVASSGTFPLYLPHVWVDHPYDTNYDALTIEDQMFYDPRIQNYQDGWPMFGINIASGQSAINAFFDDFVLKYIMSGTPQSGFLSIYKHSNTLDQLILSSIEVPYGSQRVIYASGAQLSYSSGTLGYNPYGWNHSSAPDKQGFVLADFFERANYLNPILFNEVVPLR